MKSPAVCITPSFLDHLTHSRCVRVSTVHHDILNPNFDYTKTLKVSYYPVVLDKQESFKTSYHALSAKPQLIATSGDADSGLGVITERAHCCVLQRQKLALADNLSRRILEAKDTNKLAISHHTIKATFQHFWDVDVCYKSKFKIRTISK